MIMHYTRIIRQGKGKERKRSLQNVTHMILQGFLQVCLQGKQ